MDWLSEQNNRLFRLMNEVYANLDLTVTQREKLAYFLFKTEGLKEIPIPHRIVRGNAGGRYVLKNIQWDSPEKHKELHQGEIMGRKG
jgi:hypothetical protein